MSKIWLIDELISPVFVAVRSLGHVWLLTTPWTPACRELYSLFSWLFHPFWLLQKCCCLTKFQKESFLTRYSFWRALWVRAAHCLNIAGVVCPSLSFTISQSLLNSCPLSQWCHPTISSSVTSLSSCPQSFPASGSSPVNRFFTSGGQNIGTSTSASVLPMNIQDWYPLGLTGLISLQ